MLNNRNEKINEYLQKIGDLKHKIDINNAKDTSIIIKTENEEDIVELTLAYINTLSYNCAWDFNYEIKEENNLFISIINFKYSGGIIAVDAINKLKSNTQIDHSTKWIWD